MKSRYIDPNLHLINTDLFCEEAIRFKSEGYYCNAPMGTKDYIDYWDEQKRRRIEGYSVGGVRISGAHYGYLNFSRILRETEINGVRRKIQDFPRFYDMDYFYFLEVEQARQEGLGLIVAKARRKGFSYKNAWLVANEFNLVRESISVIAGFEDKFADNTMGMVIEDLDFINKNTAWSRNREPNRREFMKAQYKEKVNGTEILSGYKSEIHKISFKDDPFKGIGKSASLFLWEEAGKFPNLISAYNFSEPTWKDGDYSIGMPIIFGTGGDMDKGTADFSYMFYNPEKFGLKAYDNEWDEGSEGRKCGLFIPDYLSRPPHIDDNGVSKMDSAIKSESIKREEMLKNSKKKSELDNYISQYCFSPREAFLIRKGNIFPAAMLAKHLGNIEANKHSSFLGQPGRLELELDGTVKWVGDESLKPVDYPIEDDNSEGCVMIYEHPEKPNQSAYGSYYATCDPYDMDKSQSGSIGSCIIWKTFTDINSSYDLPVASYHGRPEKAKDFYEIVRLLVMYYNALLLYENEKRGLEWYFEEKKCLFLMKDQPFIIDKIIKNSTVRRPKGIHMVPAIKEQAEIWAKDWLLEEDGEGSYNLTKIYDKFLLKQLIGYDDERNFDAVISFLLAILMKREMINIKPKDKDEEVSDKFFTQKLFTR
jgi:hypothetical protein